LLLLFSPPLWAQDERDAETEEAREARFAKARELYENGKVAYELSKFKEAVELFERAYALRPAPLLLFNLGQTHRQLGNLEEAQHSYEGFLREADRGMPEREVAERLLAEIEGERAAARAAARAKSAPKTPEPAARAPEPRRASPVASTSADDGGGIDPLVLWGAVGAGAAVVALAGAAFAVALVAAPPPPGDGGVLDLR
jgi:tetratricopeptide (TPR) repeat protein